MPKLSDKKKKKKKPLKQKQKQKQIVKTNVKVTVQSSGGSGGSGGGGTPSFIPQMFRDTSGENQRLVSLVEQIAARVPRQPAAAEPPVYNPANDASTRNAVFNAPINLNVPEQVGGVKLKAPRQRKPQKITVIKQPAEASAEASAEMGEAIARAQLKAMEAESEMPFYEAERFNPSNDDETLDYIFNQPNTNNNSISDRIFTSNLQKKDPIAFENNRDEIQSVISGVSNVSSYRGGGSYNPSIGSDIEFAKAGLEILKTGQALNKYIAEQRKSKPVFAGEEEASFIIPSSSSSSSSPSIMSALGSEPMSLEGLMKSGTLSAPSSVAPSSVAPSSKSSVEPSKVSTNLFKQIDDLNAQIKKETAKEKTLIGESREIQKKQFDLVNTLIEKKLALQEQAGKPKITMVEKAEKAPKADKPKMMTMVEKAATKMDVDAPFGRFKNGNPRKSPSL